MATVQDQNDQHDLYRIALYYCYIPVTNIALHIDFQRNLCTKLNLNGRVRVSHEGINGVLSGLMEDVQHYESELHRELDDNNDNEYELDMKYCHLRHDLSVTTQLFESMSVKQTRDVVSLFEPTSPHVSQNNGGQGSSSIVPQTSKRYYRRRRRNRKKHEQREHHSQDTTKTTSTTQTTPPSSLTNNNKDSSNQQSHKPQFVKPPNFDNFTPAPHLSPEQWNTRIQNLIQQGQQEDIVFVDARNVYESRIGHFAVPHTKTVLTNTRKYSSLPEVMDAHYDNTLSDKHVFMYCTGGVRCEQASVCLQALASRKTSQGTASCNTTTRNDKDDTPPPSDTFTDPSKVPLPPKGIYQLHGGIQKYLERYGSPGVSNTTTVSEEEQEEEVSSLTKKIASTSFVPGEATVETTNCAQLQDSTIISTTTSQNDNVSKDLPTHLSTKDGNNNNDDVCFYRGKNFVFDPRRTDYYVGRPKDGPIGTCLVCSTPHDDYDNGHCPSENKEARCCRCRVLILVCNKCRTTKAQCWGESPNNDSSNNNDDIGDDIGDDIDNSVKEQQGCISKQPIYCGGFDKCIDEGNHPIEQVEVVVSSPLRPSN